MTRQSDLDRHLERQADPNIDGDDDCPKCGGEMVDVNKINHRIGKIYHWRECIDCGFSEE